MNKEKFLIFTKIFWMTIAVIFLVYLDKVNENLYDIRVSIDSIGTFDGYISNDSRKIKSDNSFIPDKYEKIPLEIRIVK